MIKIRNSVLVLAVLLFTSVFTVSAENDFSPGKAKITASVLNVRNTPSTGGIVVGTVKRGDIVSAIQKSAAQSTVDDFHDYWYKVSLPDGAKGWVFGGYITFELNLEKGLRWKSVNPGSGEYFSDVSVSSSSSIFAGTDKGILYSTRDGGKSWKMIVPQALGNTVSGIKKIFLNKKELWLLSTDGTNGGIWKTGNDGSSWSQYTTAQGLPSDDVHGLFFDSEGNIWAATSKGIAVSKNKDGSSWELFSGSEKLEGGVLSIAVVKGQILAGTPKGIFTLEDKASMFGAVKKIWKPVSPSHSFKIADISATDKMIYAGSDQGLLRGNISDLSKWTTIGGKSRVQYLMIDGKNRILVATKSGLNISLDDGNSWVTYKREDGLASNDVTGISVDQNNTIWITMGKGGVAHHD